MSLREKIAFYLEDVETPIGIAINLTILGLILLSLAIFIAQTYSFSELVQISLKTVDTTILSLFTLEYLIRFWCAESKAKFLFNPFSLVDLIAILPLFLGGVNIKFIRIFRWFRILRIIRFVDFEISVFKIRKEDEIILIRILLTLFSIIFVYSGLIYQVEHQVNSQAFNTFLDALYFSVVTMTTVGFGDVTPVSEGGRLLTVLMILTGILLIPWQVGDLVKQFLKTANQVEKTCLGCGLSIHDADANFCKICGNKLEKLSIKK